MSTRGGVEAGAGAEAGQELRSCGAALKTSRRDVELWGTVPDVPHSRLVWDLPIIPAGRREATFKAADSAVAHPYRRARNVHAPHRKAPHRDSNPQ